VIAVHLLQVRRRGVVPPFDADPTVGANTSEVSS